ncbi:nuclease-related domain-containing protein [Shewanella gelidii]|uniref:nuclease-related domain-containing protein n=1 Tax=Shewanella gelidii TaxID=1642821 RepID=UPI003570EDAE
MVARLKLIISLCQSLAFSLSKLKICKAGFFGHPNHAQWTQTIHKSRFTFQNPIRQNYKHVQTLARLLNLAKKHFFSVIIFTKQGELKTKMPTFVGHIETAVTFIQSQQAPVFTPLETSEIASAF